MSAEEFCQALGFYLEAVDLDSRLSTIDVIDTQHLIFKTGRRVGTFPKATKNIYRHLGQAYEELKNLILDLAFA